MEEVKVETPTEVVDTPPVAENVKVESPVVEKVENKKMVEKITKSSSKKVNGGKKLSQISKQAKEAKMRSKPVEVETESTNLLSYIPLSPMFVLPVMGVVLGGLLFWKFHNRANGGESKENTNVSPPSKPVPPPRPPRKFEDLD